MTRYFAVLLAGVGGVVVGGIVGILAGQMPVFAWELVPLVLILATMLGGLTGGVIAAWCGKMSLGSLVGVVSIGLLFAINSRAEDNPLPITVWGVLVIALATVFASLIGSELRRWMDGRQMAGRERSRQAVP